MVFTDYDLKWKFSFARNIVGNTVHFTKFYLIIWIMRNRLFFLFGDSKEYIKWYAYMWNLMFMQLSVSKTI